MELPTELQELIDRDRITSVLVQYCRAVDRRDLAALKDVYWPDATDNHGVFNGAAHDFCDLNVQLADAMVHLTQHVIGNVDCRVEGDRAYVESCVLAYHRVKAEPEVVKNLLGESYAAQYAKDDADSHDFLVGGQYFDHFERRDGVWKIIDRTASADWSITQPGGPVSREGSLKSALDLGIDCTSARNPGPRKAA